MSAAILYAYTRRCEEYGIKPSKAARDILAVDPVTNLNLENLYLGVKGVGVIISLIRLLKSLHSINLSNCQLTNELVVELCNVCTTHPSIKELYLNKNTITLLAAKALFKLAQENPNISSIQLSDTEISEHYINRIQLQLEINVGRTQPNKDNILIDEESRKEQDDTEEWEWNTNFGDMDTLEEQALFLRGLEEQREVAMLFNPDFDDPETLVGRPAPFESIPANNCVVGNGFASQSSSPEQNLVLYHRAVLYSPPIDLVRKQQFDANQKWTDPYFPPERNSVYTNIPRRFRARMGEMHWKRVSDLHPQPTLFGSTPSAITKGRLSNKWLVSVMGVLHKVPQLLQRLFVTSYTDLGVYQIRINKNGHWISVLIDDWLPCTADGELMFCSCTDKSQFWAPLIEKAYAKLHGGYDRLNLGSSTYAFGDLTGGECKAIVIGNLAKAKQVVLDCSLWESLKCYLTNNCIVSACCRAKGIGLQYTSEIGNGISSNLLYLLCNVCEVGNDKILKLWNPWGPAKWNGRYSTSEKGLTEEILAAFSMGNNSAESGYFVVGVEDFVTYFNKFYVCNLYGDSVTLNIASILQTTSSSTDVSRWNCVKYCGEWTGRTAGGRFREQYWTENPAYGVKVKDKNTKLFVKLYQHDSRLSSKSEVNYPIEIGFYVIRTSDCSKKKKFYGGPQETVHTARFVASREVSAEFVLQPHYEYLVIPCTNRPSCEAPFGVAFWSNRPFICEPVSDPDHHYKAKGWWRRDTAGGRITGFETWVNNPQFHLKMKQTAKACISLNQQRIRNGLSTSSMNSALTTTMTMMSGADDDFDATSSVNGVSLAATATSNRFDPLYHVSYYVFRTTEGRPITEYRAKDLVTFVDFLPYPTVFKEVELEAGDYIIIPMTWVKGQQAPFELSVFTTSMATLHKLQRIVEHS